jgi:hypothetical protein
MSCIYFVFCTLVNKLKEGMQLVVFFLKGMVLVLKLLSGLEEKRLMH